MIGSDGVNLGYTYKQGAEPGEEISYRWYADEEGTIFWHDHLAGFERGMHGTFGTLVVEPEGSEWLDPETGEPIRSGTKAMIVDLNGENYREFVLAYQDFVRLFDRNGDPINPPHLQAADGHSLECKDSTWCESLEDHGVMGINYANAPLFHRDDDDPAYAFSSWVHGNPKTPLLEAYAGDPVRFRVAQTADKPRGVSFRLAGHQWPRHWTEPDTQFEGAYGLMPAGSTDVVPVGGAGGPRAQPGDYYYGAAKLRGYVE